MDIKLTTLMCGPGGTFQPGTELLGYPDAEAKALIAAGSAFEIVRQPREDTTARPSEIATTARRNRVSATGRTGRDVPPNQP